MNTPRPPGIGRDVQQVREGSTASAAELREFLQQMKGKAPQEVLGMIAQSSLVQSTVIATLGCVVVLFAGSAIPWAWAKASPAPAAPAVAKEDPAKPAAPAAAIASQPSTGAPPGETGPTEPTATSSKPKKSDDDLLERLGVGETKDADANVNPLDRGDDLLKDIK